MTDDDVKTTIEQTTGIGVGEKVDGFLLDLPEHITGGTCWCQPVIDYEDPVTGGRVLVHRLTIDGPAYVEEPTDE
jgi:hypothetical protein